MRDITLERVFPLGSDRLLPAFGVTTSVDLIEFRGHTLTLLRDKISLGAGHHISTMT